MLIEKIVSTQLAVSMQFLKLEKLTKILIFVWKDKVLLRVRKWLAEKINLITKVEPIVLSIETHFSLFL